LSLFTSLLAGVLKLRGIGGKIDEGSFPLFFCIEDFNLLVIERPETSRWRTEFLNKIWLDMKENIACRKIISCVYKA